MGDFNFDFNLFDDSSNSTKKNKKQYILLEAILSMNYGWEQIPKCELDKRCAFCLDTLLDTYVLKLPCKHMFHHNCVLEAIIEFNFKECAKCEEKFKFVGGSKKNESSDSDFDVKFELDKL